MFTHGHRSQRICEAFVFRYSNAFITAAVTFKSKVLSVFSEETNVKLKSVRSANVAFLRNLKKKTVQPQYFSSWKAWWAFFFKNLHQTSRNKREALWSLNPDGETTSFVASLNLRRKWRLLSQTARSVTMVHVPLTQKVTQKVKQLQFSELCIWWPTSDSDPNIYNQIYIESIY